MPIFGAVLAAGRGERMHVDTPKPLFPIRLLAPVGPRNHYAVTDNGQTFYAVAPLQGSSVGTTNVVVHWTPEAGKR